MANIKDIIKRPKYYLILLYGRIIPNTLEYDKKYLKKLYKYLMKKELNIDNPQTFNEKLQWLKLYDRKDIYTTMVDKYEVKEYVANIIGKEYIIPTLGIWDKFDDIDFDKLPQRFVLKCTHDSGGLVIVKDKSKLDINKARKKINHCLKRNYYKNTREWPYKNVKPRILAEEFIENDKGSIVDYKFQTFNGKNAYTQVCTDRSIGEVKFTFYDKNDKFLNLTIDNKPNDCVKGKLPSNYKKMINLAEKLSKGTYELRVDFYEINNKILFGELTFFDSGGFGYFEPDIWDLKFGKMLNINQQQ